MLEGGASGGGSGMGGEKTSVGRGWNGAEWEGEGGARVR